MKNYRIGLDVSGSIQFILDIPARNFFEAADEWARVTGHDGELFDRESYTYFGWKICITDLPAFEINPNLDPF